MVGFLFPGCSWLFGVCFQVAASGVSRPFSFHLLQIMAHSVILKPGFRTVWPLHSPVSLPNFLQLHWYLSCLFVIDDSFKPPASSSSSSSSRDDRSSSRLLQVLLMNVWILFAQVARVLQLRFVQSCDALQGITPHQPMTCS